MMLFHSSLNFTQEKIVLFLRCLTDLGCKAVQYHQHSNIENCILIHGFASRENTTFVSNQQSKIYRKGILFQNYLDFFLTPAYEVRLKVILCHASVCPHPRVYSHLANGEVPPSFLTRGSGQVPGRWGGDTLNQNSTACTCYAAGGMLLALTQEDFLVLSNCAH